MNILVDLRPLQSGKISGVEVFTENIVRTLIKLGNEHRFFLWTNSRTPLPKSFPHFAAPNAVRIHTEKSNRILNIALAFFRFPRLDRFVRREAIKQGMMTKKDRFDAVFLPDLRPAPVSHGVKKYQMVHDLSFIHFPETFSRKSRLWYRLLRFAKEIHTADKIFTPSVFTQEDLAKTLHVPRWRSIVVSEGVDAKFYPASPAEVFEVRKKYNLPEKFLLSLATLEPRKNIANLIKAFQLFVRRHPNEDLFLVIAGRKDETLFAKTSLAQEKRVIFSGFIDEDRKVALYSAAFAFIFPSFFEGFGLPPLEAMACGTPVLSSSFSSLPEVVEEAGLLFNPLKPEDICAKIETLYFDPALRQKLREKGLARARLFTWEKVARKILDTMKNEAKP